MIKKQILALALLLYLILKVPIEAQAFDSLMDLPSLPEGTILMADEETFGYRGKIGVFILPPSKAGVYFDKKEYFESETDTWPKNQSIKVIYDKKKEDTSFSGAYIILLADLSKYKTFTFMIKGQTGKESFEIGLNDVIANRREDAVIVGSIHRYLPKGLTDAWQEVKIPLSDFYGPNLSKVYSIVFHFNEEGEGTFWIDDLRFYEENLVDRQIQIKEKGFLLLDNFDHANIVNLLGRKTGTYKKLPSVAIKSWDKQVFWGDKGRSLRLDYKKASKGWCGYYTLLNQIDGEYYDLSEYKSVSFMVKGKEGGETFELGLADKSWIIIGDSIKAGTIEKYLSGGISKDWQEVVIPLEDFGALDFSQMGSFVINFHKQQEGTIYIDDLKFNLKKENQQP